MSREVAGNFNVLSIFVDACTVGGHDVVSDRKEMEISTGGKMGVSAEIAFSKVAFDSHESDFLRLGGSVSAPACDSALGDTLPSGTGCSLSIHASGGGGLGKRVEFFHGFAFGGGHAGKGRLLVVIGDAGRCLGDDFLTDDFQRKREAVGVSIGACTHCLRDARDGS